MLVAGNGDDGEGGGKKGFDELAQLSVSGLGGRRRFDDTLLASAVRRVVGLGQVLTCPGW